MNDQRFSCSRRDATCFARSSPTTRSISKIGHHAHNCGSSFFTTTEAATTTSMSSEPGSSKSGKLSSSTFDDLNLALQAAALNSTKLAAALPSDISFHRSVDSDYARTIDTCSDKALSLTNRLIKLVTDADPTSSRSKGKRKLEDREDVVDSFHSVVVDVLDQLFERGVS